MTLEQLAKINGINDYYIFWYGIGISSDYIDVEGLKTETITVNKGLSDNPDRLYFIMLGLTGKTCKYCFSIKLIPIGENNICKWKRVPCPLDEYSGRLILFRETGFSFYNSKNSAKNFIISEIWPTDTGRTVPRFSDYDSVEFTYADLQEVIYNRYSDYYNALSSVKGIYMIIDGNTGKLYIGSAYGTDGIWGRWSAYAATYHGNNIELIQLYNQYGEEYFKKFKYIILHILPMKTTDSDVINMESKYKDRFLTREFGWNDN